MLDTHKPHIKIAQYDSENGVLLLHITSTLDNVIELVVDAKSFTDWANGTVIQKCFPEFDLQTRELMISGIDFEQQKMFFNYVYG